MGLAQSFLVDNRLDGVSPEPDNYFMLLYCVQCGNKLNEGDKYCAGCGKQVARTVEVNAAEAKPRTTPGSPETKRTSFGVAKVALWLIVVFILYSLVWLGATDIGNSLFLVFLLLAIAATANFRTQLVVNIGAVLFLLLFVGNFISELYLLFEEELPIVSFILSLAAKLTLLYALADSSTVPLLKRMARWIKRQKDIPTFVPQDTSKTSKTS